MGNYTLFHLHSMLSNATTIDSASHYEEYIKLAKKHNMKALAFSEHGGVFEWIKKKQAMNKEGIKYIHGQEFYLTTTLEEKLKETYHIGLYAKNWEGVKELNKLSSIAYKKSTNHYYYKPRISLEELFQTSKNIIVTTACLGSILWQRRNELGIINKFMDWAVNNKDRVFLEIQYHNDVEQIEYNQLLHKWSQRYGLRLIAGTDTHSSSEYKAECRSILQKAKNMSYGHEDAYDLTFKTYEELIDKFKEQDSLPEEVYMEAIENTNVFADMIEDFELDTSFKYPKIYENDEEEFKSTLAKKYKQKVQDGIIDDSKGEYKKGIAEELRAFKKLGMLSFMTFMSELTTWCWDNNIPIGYNRGSVGGSVIAYIMDIIDLDPVKWNTVFSRFCNEDRVSLGDIDIDFDPNDRGKVFEYIINRFENKQTAYIITFNTVADKGTIDEIGRALKIPLSEVSVIKKDYDSDPDKARETYPHVFKYFDGIKGTITSKGMHPAGIVASPITLDDSIGFIYDEDKPIVQCGMKAIDSLNYVKFDILGLKNIGVIKKTFEYLNKRYMKSHEIDWNDSDVWRDMINSPVAIFQFEGNYAFEMLQRFKPQAINDMSIVNAALRPSGASYRDKLMAKEFHNNPSEQIDELLKDNMGYLIFQEDTIKFLTDICGFSGAEADNVRRAIGKKDMEKLQEALPLILDGYCSKSDKSRDIAEQEAKEFIQIISDSSDYQFGYNHSTGYSMVGYTCAMLRYYYPLEFTTSFLNQAANDDDIKNGAELAKMKGIKILPPKYGFSKGEYFFDREDNAIYKGIGSIKFLNEDVGNKLYELSKTKKHDTFSDLLYDIQHNSIANFKQIKILATLNFFSEFGGNQKLLNIIDKYEARLKNRDLKEGTKVKRLEEINTYEKEINNDKVGIKEQIRAEIDYYGYEVTIIEKSPESVYIVTGIDTKYAPKIRLYNLHSGEVLNLKCSKAEMKKNMFGQYSIIQVKQTVNKKKKRPVNGKWVEIDEMEQHLTLWNVLR
ncbi:hypothetical protein BEH_07870 [Priestia filamentosa]|uniref:Polymerase/histidinol phosphatase N-terminal domain-containing protein n=1 Tax=Priestia filamentosa TaxID=1402861 RepID=A0A2S1LZC9_9BACI|nr:PHP domain-containing protein [Priestia filamentosa]AWG44165.1 hypothetical protein BEH_07870 [Priestia filamentosa]